MSRPPEDIAEGARRAAALWRHWSRGDMDGIAAVTEELGADEAEWITLLCSVLNVGFNMVRAAPFGKVEEYLDTVLKTSSLDEIHHKTTSPDTPS